MDQALCRLAVCASPAAKMPSLPALPDMLLVKVIGPGFPVAGKILVLDLVMRPSYRGFLAIVVVAGYQY